MTSASPKAGGKQLVAFEVYGTRACVSIPTPELVPQVVDQFPLHAAPCEAQEGDREFELRLEDDGGYTVLQDGMVVSRPPRLEGALAVLRRRLFRHAIERARDRLAVHAGVVGYRGRAIVMPGSAMVGKTTLVVALLRAGAEYFTDDFALIDEDGLAHPYPNRLFIKGEEDKPTPESLGAARGEVPLPVGVIASIRYREGSDWQPRECTAGEGVVTLLRNAYGLDLPQFALEAARAAATNAIVIESERNEAEDAATALLRIASGAN